MPHIHEKIDFTVEVFVVHKNKLLLRMHDKLKIWLSVGGHIELDEDPVQAALREVKEEVGLDVTLVGDTPEQNDDKFTYLMTPRYLGRQFFNETHEHVVTVYFAKTDTDILSPAKSDHEKSETKWVTKEELDQMNLLPNIRFFAEQALKELGK